MKNEFKRAVDLMQARYDAYTKGDIDFIVRTHDPETAVDLDVEETKKWADESEWLGLKIISTEKGEEDDDYGIVEFEAEFSEKGIHKIHHEKSEFKKKDGSWYYSGWLPLQGTIVKGKKIGANESCPCNSGKKYKKCCGKN